MLFLRSICRWLLCLTPFGFMALGAPGQGQPRIKINGSTTVNPVVVEVAEHFQKQGWQVLVDTQGGSSGGVSFVAEGLANLGMASRPLADHDYKKYPQADFRVFTIGYDGVALVVSKKLFDSGIQVLTRDQIKAIYQSELTNWAQLGGPNWPIVFFNKEPGRGTWEVFAHFVYDDPKRAPKVFHPEVGSNQEARTKVAQSRGGITQLSASWAEQSPLVTALALNIAGATIKPGLAEIRSGAYPMKRPLNVITNGPPSVEVKAFIDFLLGPQGQEIVKRNGYLTVTGLGT